VLLLAMVNLVDELWGQDRPLPIQEERLLCRLTPQGRTF
jgi:hypothetical protein